MSHGFQTLGKMQVSRCDVTGRRAVWYDACAEIRLSAMASGNLLNMDRSEHHSIDHLKEKRSGERKRPTFSPPRSGAICVQPGKLWHCFEGNLEKTAERQGGARMGVSERHLELRLN